MHLINEVRPIFLGPVLFVCFKIPEIPDTVWNSADHRARIASRCHPGVEYPALLDAGGVSLSVLSSSALLN